MASTFDLSVIFRAIDKMSVPMAQMQKKIDQFSKKAQKIGKGFENVGKSMMTHLTLPIAALAGIGVKSFAEQEEAIFRLQNAIKLTGREGEISVDSLVKMADELQGVTKFSDDATISAMALVQQMGNLSEAQIKEVIPAMQDYAALTGTDLQSAAMMFGKSLSSGNNYLKRQGILFEESADKAQFFKNMVEAVNQKAGGTAKQAAKGLSGALFQLKNNFGEIAETIGEQLSPIVIKISQKFRQFKDWFNNLSPAMKKFIVTTMLIVAAIGPLIFIIGKLISIVGMAGKAFQVLRAVLTPQGIIIMAIVLAIIALIIVIRNWGKITAWFSDKWSKLVDFIQRMPRILFILARVFQPVLFLPLMIIRNWETIKTFFSNLLNGIWNLFDNWIVQLVGSVIMPFIGLPITIIKNWSSIADFFTTLWQGIVNAFITAIDFIKNIWETFTGWAMKNPVLKWLFETKPKKTTIDSKQKEAEKKIEDDKNKDKTKKSLLNMDSMFTNFKKTKDEKSVVYVNVKVMPEDGALAKIDDVKSTGNVKKKITTDGNTLGRSTM
jgi:phage-related minor tail protein